MSDDLREYRTMFERIEGRVFRRVEIAPRLRAAILVAVLVELCVMFLPQAGGADGWAALVAADAARSEMVGILARIALHGSLIFCVLLTCAALRAASFPVMVAALAGCAITTVFSFLAFWARQSSHVAPSGPGVGAALILVTAAVLTALWAVAVLSSTIPALAATTARGRQAPRGEVTR